MSDITTPEPPRLLLPQFQTPEYTPQTDERTAWARLLEFLELKRLRIVTTIPDDYGSQHYQPNDPRYYQLRTVVRLKVLDKKPHRPIDKVVAWADDETSVQGTPSAVLHRCTEWARFLEAEKRQQRNGLFLPGRDVVIHAVVARIGGPKDG
ncbi:MAG: hypothetical protein AB7R89_25730 [Dehalococcoidia bacterium]